MNKIENQKYWLAQVLEFQKSGKEKKEWCEKNNISIHQFNYYLRQKSEKDSPFAENSKKQWLPVEIKQEEVFLNSPLVIKIGIAAVEICPGFDKDHLLEVLKTLKAL